MVHNAKKTEHNIAGRNETTQLSHAIDFLLTVTNGKTGEVVIPVYLVSSRLRAFGGVEALAAESQGITQKVRITGHLAELIKQELTGVPALPTV